jgi:TonB family protein
MSVTALLRNIDSYCRHCYTGVESKITRKNERDFIMNQMTIPHGFFRFTIIVSIFMLCMSCTPPAPIKEEKSVSDRKQTYPIDAKSFMSSDSIPAFDEPPVLLYFARPKYPETAIKMKREGVVKVKLTVDEECRVVKAELFESTATEAMDNAPLEAARQCRFKPAKKDGVPVLTQVMIPFQFSLNP